MNAMIDDGDIVTIGMPKEKAKVIMEFLSSFNSDDIKRIIESDNKNSLDANTADRVLYELYDNLYCTLEGGDDL